MKRSDVLLASQDPEWSALLCQLLEAAQLAPWPCGLDAAGAAALVRRGAARMALIDGSDAAAGVNEGSLSLLRALRSASRLPILYLTAPGACDRRARALALGADACREKAGDAATLLLGLRSLLPGPVAGAGAVAASVLFSGPLALRIEAQEARWNGCALDLTTTEFRLLGALVRACGVPLGRRELALRALGQPPAPFDRAIDLQLHALGEKLAASTRGAAYVRAAHPAGFQLVCA